MNIEIPLKNNHFINAADGTVEFGFTDDTGGHVAYGSVALPHLPTEEELAAVGVLLMGGADWAAINTVLLALAGQKDGQNYLTAK